MLCSFLEAQKDDEKEVCFLFLGTVGESREICWNLLCLILLLSFLENLKPKHCQPMSLCLFSFL
jgi:hypothetical protein